MFLLINEKPEVKELTATPLAQLAEQLPFNQLVTISIPMHEKIYVGIL